MWICSEECQLNTNDLQKNLLLAKDEDGYIVWLHAAFFWQIRGITDIMQFG